MCLILEPNAEGENVLWLWEDNKVQPHQGRVRSQRITRFLRLLMRAGSLLRGLEWALLRLFHPLWKVHRQMKVCRGQNIKADPAECHKLRRKGLKLFSSGYIPTCISASLYRFLRRCRSRDHMPPQRCHCLWIWSHLTGGKKNLCWEKCSSPASTENQSVW